MRPAAPLAASVVRRVIHTERHKDRKIEDRKMGMFFIFLSSIFLS